MTTKETQRNFKNHFLKHQIVVEATKTRWTNTPVKDESHGESTINSWFVCFPLVYLLILDMAQACDEAQAEGYH